MHYTREQWRMFLRGKMPAGARADMEEHLAACGRCLEAYLAVIEQADIDLAERSLGPGFTERVVAAAAREPGDVVGPAAGVTVRPDPGSPPAGALRHYLVAAAITAVLFAAGWFDAVTRAVPATLRETTAVFEGIRLERPTSWAEGLVDRASGFLTGLLRGGG